MDLVYLFRVLLKRKWLIIGATILAAGIAWFLTRNQAKKFRSTTRISTGFTVSVSEEVKLNSENFNFYEAESKFVNAIATITSPVVANLVSYSLILHDLKDSTPYHHLTEEQRESSIYKSINKEAAISTFASKLENMAMLTSFNPEEKRLMEFLDLYGYGYKTISSNLNAFRLDRTDYIQVDYVSDDPELSAFAVNAAFQQFLRYYQKIRSTNSQESIDTLKSLMDKKKQELDTKNNLLRGEGLSINGGATSNLDLIANLEQTLAAEKSRQVQLYSELRKVNQRITAMGGSSSTTKPASSNNDELLALRKAKNEAYSAYLNSGSTDKSLLDKYNKLNADYQEKILNSGNTRTNTGTDNTRDAALTSLHNQRNDISIDIEASNTNIQQLQGKIGALKGSVAYEASKGATVETLLKDVDLANKEYLSAKQKYTDAIDMSSSSVNNFRQVLVGQPATDPEPSKRKLFVALAGIATMITIMLVIILLTYLDNSLKTPVIFAKQVDLRLLSMVNFTSLQNKSLVEILSRKESNASIDQKRHNVFRESIRKLRYEVEITGKKIFLFTSTKKNMGKTTLIQALSYSLSFSKKKVLIIDTNFCNNDLTIQLNAIPVLEKMAPTRVISESDLLAEVRRSAHKIDEEGHISVIGSEGGDYTPSEILPQQNLLQHLRTLTKEFDYIFLEGPPLNDFSDSKELSQYVDGVIGVFAATHSMKLIDKESIKFFKELNGKFTGAILNMVELENINVA